jgi:hypothetical protein
VSPTWPTPYNLYMSVDVRPPILGESLEKRLTGGLHSIGAWNASNHSPESVAHPR